MNKVLTGTEPDELIVVVVQGVLGVLAFGVDDLLYDLIDLSQLRWDRVVDDLALAILCFGIEIDHDPNQEKCVEADLDDELLLHDFVVELLEALV